MKNPSELSTATILALAQERIRNSDHWCKHILGRDKDGSGTDGISDNTVQWCARGALLKVFGASDQWNVPRLPAEEYLDRAAREIYGADGDIPDYWITDHRWLYVGVNNYKEHKDVMRIFDRAIELAAADEKVNSEEHACA
jgi:hypothetical protein